MDEKENKEFFSKLWRCPVRKGWRYGRKFFFAVLLGVFVWMVLDFMAIVLMKPRTYPPFLSLAVHAFLTIAFSIALTLITRQLRVRLNSRFRLIRVFQPSREAPHDS